MRGLGSLEAGVMDVLWAADHPLRVREVMERLVTARPLAYTTVMTILDNLHRKGYAQREMRDRAYHYQPAATREESAAAAIRDLLREAGDAEAVLLHFARTASDGESKVLRSGLNRRQRST